MSSRTRRLLTEEEYLLIERRTPTKSEYFDGDVFALAGASLRHNLIVVNVVTALHAQLRGGPCRVLANDMRVRAGLGRLYTYPDIVVVCGEPKFLDAELDTLMNPTLIVEVLSPSTEDFDRGRKLSLYRGIPSLSEYVTLPQDRVEVEHHVRKDGVWITSDAITDRDAVISLESISCALKLSDVYEGVTLDAPPA